MKLLQNITLKQALEESERPSVRKKDLNQIVDEVFREVRSNGDVALKRYTHFFDQVDLDDFEVNEETINSASSQIPDTLKSAIQLAAANIERFHRSQVNQIRKIETSPGVICWQESRPVEKIGIYIPGGTAPLFSTVLMLGIPAQIAGCKEIVLCTPPGKDGLVNPAILYAAQLVGVTRVFRVGGAQAIAAMTYGTEQVPSVYKIFGPGNQYVTAAKQKAQAEGVAIDMPAGPSELLIVADESCNPAFVAADLLSQAEHGTDSQVICLVNQIELAEKVIEEVNSQLQRLSRGEIASEALQKGAVIVFADQSDALQFVNEYAPEHLILAVSDPDQWIPEVINAGSVFLGNNTPESAGDYASGTNHTLPTAGFAKAYSGVNLDAFTKKITFQQISEEGIQGIGPAIEEMALAEMLDAHKNAVTIRLKNINELC